MDVTARIWNVKDGEVTELKHDGSIFVLKVIKPKPNLTYMVPVKTIPKPIVKKPHKRGIKLSYLEKWIQDGVFEVFTIEQFFKTYPKQRKNKNLSHNVLKLLEDKKIGQLSKDRYMVKRVLKT